MQISGTEFYPNPKINVNISEARNCSSQSKAWPSVHLFFYQIHSFFLHFSRHFLSRIFSKSQVRFRKERLKFHLPCHVKYNLHCPNFKETRHFWNDCVPNSTRIRVWEQGKYSFQHVNKVWLYLHRFSTKTRLLDKFLTSVPNIIKIRHSG